MEKNYVLRRLLVASAWIVSILALGVNHITLATNDASKYQPVLIQSISMAGLALAIAGCVVVLDRSSIVTVVVPIVIALWVVVAALSRWSHEFA